MVAEITIKELVDSGEKSTGDNGQTTLKYLIVGTEEYTKDEALAALNTQAPETDGTYYRQSRNVEPVGDPALSLMYKGTVTYAPRQSSDYAGSEELSAFSFDTTGGTIHITQSLSTVQKYGTAPNNYKGAINVSRDGGNITVDGVDIVSPTYSFSETHYFAPEDVDNDYKGHIFSLTGKVNNATFKGLLAGECLFLGASGSQRGTGNWEITFNFAGMPNRTGITVGDITSIAKKGWEYMWVEYSETKDSVTSALVKTPSAAYIEQVYEYGDFDDLGI
jgi:hypothetical protein